MLESIPFNELGSVLSSSPYPQYNKDTIQHYLKLDTLFKDKPVLLHDGVPVFSPCTLRGRDSYSWYWDALMVVPYVPVDYALLPGLWSEMSRQTNCPAVLSSGVMAHGSTAGMEDFAWLATEHASHYDPSLNSFSAKRRYKLKQGFEEFDQVTELVEIPNTAAEPYIETLLGRQAIHWKSRCKNTFEYEFALRQWIWAMSVCTTDRGKMFTLEDRLTGSPLATLVFYDQNTHWMFGAFCQFPGTDGKLVSGVGSYSLYECVRRLDADPTKPVFLGTCASELDDEKYLVYKLNCANTERKLPCFASRGINCDIPSIQPPLFDVASDSWVD